MNSTEKPAPLRWLTPPCLKVDIETLIFSKITSFYMLRMDLLAQLFLRKIYIEQINRFEICFKTHFFAITNDRRGIDVIRKAVKPFKRILAENTILENYTFIEIS